MLAKREMLKIHRFAQCGKCAKLRKMRVCVKVENVAGVTLS
jgi:hypothetical protein